LNVDVSSFGKSIDEAVVNLKDAVELYLKDDSATYLFHDVGEALIGEASVNA
jgi:predicted RNase H-like HicB family nuclease